MEFKHESYFLEKRKPEIIESFKAVYDIYAEEKSINSFEKDGEKYVKGFNIAYYHHGGLIWEPIIFDIKTGNIEIEYSKMGLNDSESINKYIKDKNNPYKVLETFCLVFYDGVEKYEFLFNSATHYKEIRLFNKDTRQEVSNKLNEAFFIKPLVHQLELDLQEKSFKNTKPKI